VQLKSLSVKNFRALEDIQVDFDNRVNVIVGPNAIGKTTVLEAIRLNKALLAPRTGNESNQVLFALGLAAPQAPQQLIPEAVASDLSKTTEIRCRYQLADNELDDIESGLPQIATNVLQARMGQPFANPALLTSFLSSSAGGQVLEAVQSELRTGLQTARAAGRVCRLELTFDFKAGRINNPHPVETAFFAFLDQRQPPNRSVFSYFPADRALPSGEQPVQLGSADAIQQLESHNSQPQTKYTRLKNTIFNALVTSTVERDALIKDFARIFDGILKGRRLRDPGVDRYGLLTIPIEDIETGKTFNIDALSSGEKGLILTFLLISRSIAQDGIILLDEPELHLNPPVCRDLLAFLVDAYAAPIEVRII
jgi:energy-coupling factor transporter ATP-binding protein EcfA2